MKTYEGGRRTGIVEALLHFLDNPVPHVAPQVRLEFVQFQKPGLRIARYYVEQGAEDGEPVSNLSVGNCMNIAHKPLYSHDQYREFATTSQWTTNIE